MAKKNTKVVKKKKLTISLTDPSVHIHASFNNTIITVVNGKGEVITWSSGGALGYKGSKKSTPFAAQLAANACIKTALELGIKEVSIRSRGVGPGRESVIRTFQNSEINVSNVKDITPRPFNGCRRKKSLRNV